MSYDSFYFQTKILNDLLNKKEFDEFVKKNKISEPYLKGYIYLIEITINSFIHSIENLIKEDNISDLIHFNGKKEEERSKNYKNSSEEIRNIINLEKSKDKLTKIRFNEINKIIEFDKILDEINKKTNRIKEFYLSKNRVKINEKNKKDEDIFRIIEFFNNQNYIDVHFDILNFKKNGIPTYPTGYYYNSLNNKIDYHLQNPNIKQFENEYIRGYSLGLAFIYNSLNIIPKNLIIELLNSKKWIDIHNIGFKIYRSLPKDIDIEYVKSAIYEEKESFTKIAKLKKEEINEKDLGFLFRNREIITIEQKHKGYPDEMIPFFKDVILGKILEEKTEIIELRTEKRDNEIWFSYAIPIYYGGSMWNGSYWVLFRDIAFTRGNYKTNGKAVIDGLFNDKYFINKYIVHKHKVDNKILDRYLQKIDHNYQVKEQLNERLKDSNSMLVELLGLVYYLKNKEENASFEWGTELIENKKVYGEADLLIYLKNKVYIIQAKTFLPFIESAKVVNEIVKHFNTVQKFLIEKRKEKSKDKEIKKELFVFENYEFEEYKNSKELKENNIKIIFFEDFLNKNPSFLPKSIKTKLNKCIKGEYNYNNIKDEFNDF